MRALAVSAVFLALAVAGCGGGVSSHTEAAENGVTIGNEQIPAQTRLREQIERFDRVGEEAGTAAPQLPNPKICPPGGCGPIRPPFHRFVARPPTRTRYVRTDAEWDYGFLNFAPQQWILYDPPTKRFFASNTGLNRIDVLSANTELLVGQIVVPGAWVGDETPDHKSIYLGTQIGDVYQIDPVAMQVIKRYPAAEIGPAGFAAYEVKVLADGRLALLGGQGGIPAVDGYSRVAMWNPADNTLVMAGRTAVLYGCALQSYISEFAVTADRTKILLGSGVSGGNLCLYDPVTDAQRVVETNPLGIGLPSILVPPDGKEVIIPEGAQVTVYDAIQLFQVDQFQIGDGTSNYHCLLSMDGKTLFAIAGQTTLAIDWKTHRQKGWVQTFTSGDLISSINPQAVDENGLIAGVIGRGVSFLDSADPIMAQPGPQVPNPFVEPPFGAEAGGTQVVFPSDFSSNRLKGLYFGANEATGASVGGAGISVSTPPGDPGPLDVAALANDGALELAAEGFSYGPWIVEVTPDSSTAEGTGTVTIYGYGLGPVGTSATQSPSLQVTVGGQSAPVTGYSGAPYDPGDPYYPFPVVAAQVTVPPGTAGSSADITVSDSVGSTTLKDGLHYLPAIQQYPLSGSVLVQGIYDRKRNLYYFTDQTTVLVFSAANKSWQTPINLPGAMRLWGISLSPDGTKLAVSDAGADVIYLVNPDSPQSVRTFALPNVAFDQGGEPCGLAISDSGIVYYDSFYVSSTGGYSLHKLDTSTGVVTNYQMQAGNLGYDAYTRVLLSADNARVYANFDGFVVAIDTATDTVFFNPVLAGGDYELTLARNGTWMSATEYLLDTNLNPISYLVLNQRETWNVNAVYGEKLSPDGSLLFEPLLNAIDVADGKTGTLRTRIALPVTLSPNYDALVADGKDNVLVAITGANGSGIAIIDLTSLPEPLPLAHTAASKSVLVPMTRKNPVLTTIKPDSGSDKLGYRYKGHSVQREHIVNNLAGRSQR